MDPLGNVCGGRGKCSKCGEIVGNVAYHESVCGKIDIESREQRIKDVCRSLIEQAELNHGHLLDYPLDTQARLGLAFKSGEDKTKELEEENKKLRETVRVLSERLINTNKRINRIMEDSYNDIAADRDDYR